MAVSDDLYQVRSPKHVLQKKKVNKPKVNTEDEILDGINKILNVINDQYGTSLIKQSVSQKVSSTSEGKHKLSEKKEKVKTLVKKEKKNTQKKQTVDSFSVESYETYLSSVLLKIKGSDSQNLKWTEAIEKTCNIANSILMMMKDSKKQLETQNDPYKREAILNEMQKQVKALDSIKEVINKQVELQQAEKAHQKKRVARMRRYHRERLRNMHNAAAHNFVDNHNEMLTKKDIEEGVDNITEIASDVIDLVNDVVRKDDEDKQSIIKMPTSLPDKKQKPLSISMLSSIITAESLKMKHDNKKVYQNGELQGIEEAIDMLSPVSPLNSSKNSTSPNEMSIVENVKLYFEPVTDKKVADDKKSQENHDVNIFGIPNLNSTFIMENLDKDNDKKDKEKEKEKEKEQEQENKKTPKEILIAEIKGNKYVIFKKTEDGRCEQIEDGTLFADKNAKDGEYILYPKPEKEEDMPSQEKLQKEEHLTLVITEGQEVPLNEEFRTKLTLKNRKAGKVAEAEEVKRPSELVDRRLMGKAMSFER